MMFGLRDQPFYLYQNVGSHTLQLVINLILILVKKEKNLGLIQSITKTVMNVYKALFCSLNQNKVYKKNPVSDGIPEK